MFTECRAARKYGLVISDGCARTIAGWYVDGSATGSAGNVFHATGEVIDVNRIFAEYTMGGIRYVGASARHRRAIEQFAVYLLTRTGRGPIPGWSSCRAGFRR